MGKKKGVKRPSVGSRVRVKEGVMSPEFDDINLSGWTADVLEVSGSGTKTKYVLEWDDATVNAMPEEYVKRCEENNLFHKMAYLGRDDVSLIES